MSQPLTERRRAAIERALGNADGDATSWAYLYRTDVSVLLDEVDRLKEELAESEARSAKAEEWIKYNRRD